MAPTKKDGEKEAKLTPEQSAALIMDYLRKQNRPYSATDISTNLKNRVTKAAAAKLLKDMHERGEIEGRAAGKQIVYHVIQDEPDEDALTTLQTMEAETARLREAATALKVEEKELRAALRDGAFRISMPDLQASVAALQEQKKGMTVRLDVLKGGSVRPVSEEERTKVDAEFRKWKKTAAARKTIRRELWDIIEGQMGKEKGAEIKEQLGVEL